MRLPNIQHCSYVALSDLKCFFEGDQFRAFVDNIADGGSITWGDTNRALISIDRFKGEVDAATDANGGNIQIAHITDFNSYLDELQSKDVYIDFEN